MPKSPAAQKKPPRKSIKIIAPRESKERFIRSCLGKEYVHADMKNKYQDIAKKYPEWFECNELPLDLRGSEYKRYREYRC
ncbi:hypothetical protein C6H68_14190 [Photorhabdus luminescens]|nr:hypothetical protein C6H68_14190 [Photorhabdus luminescens]